VNSRVVEIIPQVSVSLLREEILVGPLNNMPARVNNG